VQKTYSTTAYHIHTSRPLATARGKLSAPGIFIYPSMEKDTAVSSTSSLLPVPVGLIGVLPVPAERADTLLRFGTLPGAWPTPGPISAESHTGPGWKRHGG
jgi:hypothetical protein